MKADLLIETLKGLVSIQRPVCVESDPGVGKTSVWRQVAKQLGIGFIHIHAPSLLVENVGIPYPDVEVKRVEFFLTNLLPCLGSPREARGIVLVDEIAQCPDEIQKMFANIFQERECYGHSIMEGWTFGATMNSITSRSGANRLLAHFSDRMTHLKMDFCEKLWCEYALDQGCDTRIIAFARSHPDKINAFDASRDISATPRSWLEGVNRNMKVVPKAALMEVLMGDIASIAVDFLGFMDFYTVMPTKEELMKHPKAALKRLREHEITEKEDDKGNVTRTMVHIPGRTGDIEPSIQWMVASMLLTNMCVDDFEAAMDVAAELKTDMGSMVYLNYIRKVNAITSQKTKRLRQELTRYKGVVMGEWHAEMAKQLEEAA